MTRELAGVFERRMVNMPGLLAFLRSSPADTRQAYVGNLLRAAFSPPRGEYEGSDEKWVESNEISTVTVVLHYAEAVMTRYDSNKDGVLRNSELRQAVPVFTGYIKKYANESLDIPDLAEWKARGAFSLHPQVQGYADDGLAVVGRCRF
ncbi:MAG: hypothetical protein HC902_02510 [Calothrix sp. SM1_5_4]|nr:hypothetical protein [Calothrix sp. SM1_5_4]